MKLPPHAGLYYTVVLLKPKNEVNNLPYLGNALFKISNISMIDAWNVTGFYALLTFCMSLVGIFLLETIFIFPQHCLSCEGHMVYLDCYWLSAYQLPFMGMSTLSQLGAWIFLSMAIKIAIFKHYLCCASMENLFTIHVFEISAKICTCPCNFRSQKFD